MLSYEKMAVSSKLQRENEKKKMRKRIFCFVADVDSSLKPERGREDLFVSVHTWRKEDSGQVLWASAYFLEWNV